MLSALYSIFWQFVLNRPPKSRQPTSTIPRDSRRRINRQQSVRIRLSARIAHIIEPEVASSSDSKKIVIRDRIVGPGSVSGRTRERQDTAVVGTRDVRKRIDAICTFKVVYSVSEVSIGEIVGSTGGVDSCATCD